MPPNHRVNAIDSLRAIAMTMVIAQHCWILPLGWIGVWLFFVISGYVITSGFPPTTGADRSLRREVFGAFMRRRSIRIVPVYVLYLLINVPIIVYINESYRLWDLPYLLGFIFNWHRIFAFWPRGSDWSAFEHLWTLSVEQQFYLLFPLLILFVAPALQMRWTLILIVAGPLIRFAGATALARHWSHDPQALAFAIYAGSLFHFDAFLLGSLLARCHRDAICSAWLDRNLAPIAFKVSLVYAGTYVAVNLAKGAAGVDALRNVYSGILYGEGREVFVYLSVNLLAAAAVWYAVNMAPPNHWLNSRRLAWVGQVSYGGYLVHALVLWTAAQWLGSPLRDLPILGRVALFGFAWTLTVSLASVSFVWFETPLARRLRPRARATRSLESSHALSAGRER